MHELIRAERQGFPQTWSYDQFKYFLQGYNAGETAVCPNDFPESINTGTLGRVLDNLLLHTERMGNEHCRVASFDRRGVLFSRVMQGNQERAYDEESSEGVFSEALEYVADEEDYSGFINLHTHTTPIVLSPSDVLGLRVPYSQIAQGLGAGSYKYFIFRSSETPLLEDKKLLDMLDTADESGDTYFKWWMKYVSKYLKNKLSHEEVDIIKNFRYDPTLAFFAALDGEDYDASLAKIYDKFLRTEAEEQELVVYVGKAGDQIVYRHPLDQPLPRG